MGVNVSQWQTHKLKKVLITRAKICNTPATEFTYVGNNIMLYLDKLI